MVLGRNWHGIVFFCAVQVIMKCHHYWIPLVFLVVEMFSVDVDFSSMLLPYKHVCCNFQIAVPVWTHVLPLFCFWRTTGPMITEKHDKHMSETFMWILPNLLYEALCTGIPPLPCIFSNFILMFKAIQSVCSFVIFYLFAISDGRIIQLVRLGWWSIA